MAVTSYYLKGPWAGVTRNVTNADYDAPPVRLDMLEIDGFRGQYEMVDQRRTPLGVSVRYKWVEVRKAATLPSKQGYQVL